MFNEGEDVLMRGSDGLLYLGVLVEIDEDEASPYLIRFGDGGEKRAKCGDLRRLGGSGSGSNWPEPEPPVSGPPTPPPPILAPFDGMDVPFHVLQARRELPYDFDSLIWDANHERNIDEKYCYCGESGSWYKKMLQCQRCQQWFHQECIRNPNVSQLLFGDRFYEFVCTLCTGTSEEVVRRLHMGWVDALHLILFNLIVTNRKEHHDLETAIIPLLKKKLKYLQSPSSVLNSSRIEPKYLEALLKSNKTRFKCGSSSKRSKFWTLIKVGPPLAPHQKFQFHNYTSVVDVNFKKTVQSKPTMKKSSPQQRRPALKLAKRGGDDFNGDSSDAGSFGSLDSFIPRPKNFAGRNNPFRTEIVAADFATTFLRPSKRDRKRRWSPPSLGSAGSSPHSSISSLSSNNEVIGPSASIAPPQQPQQPPVVIPVAKKVDEDWKVVKDLKWSINSYFEASHRIARGEKFHVIAKRCERVDGQVQHLMAWDQPITKPFLSPPKNSKPIVHSDDDELSSS